MKFIPIRRAALPILICLACALLNGCAKPSRVESKPPQQPPIASTSPASFDEDPITRAEVLELARAYATHQWRATTANIFHGVDDNGVRVDTPDAQWWGRTGWHADGRVMIGVPYCWGGKSTLEEFDSGLRQGRPAGHTFHGPRPRSSRLPVGVDCSGLVSRCWRLKKRRSTATIPEVCDVLTSFDNLLPGDVANRPHGHVVIFIEWLDPQQEKMRVIEATDSSVRQSEHTVTRLKQRGFAPLRFRGIVD